MPLTAGDKIGSYEILAAIGAGGMGEVYRARDSKLKRAVAIKVLPIEVANDRERLARFQREAEVLASLNHPHIAQVYGIEEHALVMELVEGEDLSERIARGPIPIDEALPIAKQIAEALEAAHDAGIIHRDLKPANIKVRDDGAVKVLDFGLAKALDLVGETGGDVANSPTITSPGMTMRGVILGTAAYMSPEQAKGKVVDRRADIWAFGCVLYEMLTGRRPFTGDDVTDIITSVMRDAPDWTALPASTPPAIRALLRRCLEKDARKRTPHIAVARIDIDDAIHGAAQPGDAVRSEHIPRSASFRLVAATAGLAAIAVSVWVGARYFAPPPPAPTPLRFEFTGPLATPYTSRATAFVSLAPDGTRMVYLGQRSGEPRKLWLHSFVTGLSRALDHTENGSSAFWSPDGLTVAFTADNKLQRVDVSSGAVQTVCGDCSPGLPGAWNSGNMILFGANSIQRVSAGGGSASPVTKVNTANGEMRHDRPRFLPDGRHFLFTAVNEDPAKTTLRFAELGAATTRDLGNIASGADYLDAGYLVYAQDAKLMARAFDADAGDWRGDPIVVSDVVRQQGLGFAAFSASRTGVIAFDPMPLFGETLEHLWVDRAGHILSSFSAPSNGHTLALAPTAPVAAVEQSGVIWIVDGERGSRVPLTAGRLTDGHPVWSPDGQRIAYFEGQPGGVTQLFIKAVQGTSDPEPLLPESERAKTSKQLTDWSRDGRYLLFEEQTPGSGWDIKYVDLSSGRRVKALLNRPYHERLAQLSPDGTLVAYESSEAGSVQIYMTDFPKAAERWPVSTQGGFKPRWNNNGRELTYVDAAGMLQSVAVSVKDGFKAAVPVPLFEHGGVETDGFNYAISRDGSKFLIMRPSRTSASPRLSVIVNWPATLAK